MRDVPQKVNVEDVKAKLSCQTSQKVRVEDVKTKLVKTKLVKTKLSCKTSLKNIEISLL